MNELPEDDDAFSKNPFADEEQVPSTGIILLASGLESTPFPDRLRRVDSEGTESLDLLLAIRDVIREAQDRGISILNLEAAGNRSLDGLGAVLAALATTPLFLKTRMALLESPNLPALERVITLDAPLWSMDTLAAMAADLDPVSVDPGRPVDETLSALTPAATSLVSNAGGEDDEQ